MNTIRFRMRSRIRFSSPVFFVAALATTAVLPWSGSMAQGQAPAIDFHAISAGGHTLSSSCFRLAGTVGQAAPGYSGAANFSLVAGFQAAPGGRDDIFFYGFEEC